MIYGLKQPPFPHSMRGLFQLSKLLPRPKHRRAGQRNFIKLVGVSMKRLIPLIALATLTGCGAVDSGITQDTDKMMGTFYMLLLLAFLLFGRSGTTPIAKLLKYAAIWGGLLIFLMLAYSYRTNPDGVVGRLQSELLPAVPQTTDSGDVILTKGSNGHFSTRAMVNGEPNFFLIDTGASDVVLPYRDAEKLGFNPSGLAFSQIVSTANGTAYAAPIVIDTLEIGGITVTNVRASVSQEGNLDTALLGMSFLNRISSFTFAGDKLMLRP